MPGVARLGDSINGTTSGEHNGHYDEFGSPIHGPSTIYGEINSNCSSNVFINGKNCAFKGSQTLESDSCDSNQRGSIAVGSSTVFVNGNPIARNGDSINPHNGTASISSGSQNVYAGG